MPKRIQRRRTKGWEMPPGAVYVGRPGIWGNPFSHANREYAIAAYRRYTLAAIGDAFEFSWVEVNHKWITNRSQLPVQVKLGVTYSEGENDGRRKPLLFRPFEGFDEALTMHMLPNLYCRSLDELVLRDLCCWCPLDQACHADVLLELANPPGVANANQS